ncbi:hypothetical protein V8C34DRAFT_300672 [Trichoderma compactum]
MAASATCICVVLGSVAAAAAVVAVAASQARGQHGRVGVGQIQSQVPMYLQFSSPSSSAIRRGPARIRSGQVRPGQDQESQQGRNGTCEGRQASAVEDVCLTLGLRGGSTTACMLDTLIRSWPQIVSITSRVPYRACNR